MKSILAVFFVFLISGAISAKQRFGSRVVNSWTVAGVVYTMYNHSCREYSVEGTNGFSYAFTVLNGCEGRPGGNPEGGDNGANTLFCMQYPRICGSSL
jgi:hypothetical protein